MADSFIQAPPDSTGKKLDTNEVTVSGNVVQQQRIVIVAMDAATAAQLAALVTAMTALNAAIQSVLVAAAPISGLPALRNLPTT